MHFFGLSIVNLLLTVHGMNNIKSLLVISVKETRKVIRYRKQEHHGLRDRMQKAYCYCPYEVQETYCL